MSNVFFAKCPGLVCIDCYGDTVKHTKGQQKVADGLWWDTITVAPCEALKADGIIGDIAVTEWAHEFWANLNS